MAVVDHFRSLHLFELALSIDKGGHCLNFQLLRFWSGVCRSWKLILGHERRLDLAKRSQWRLLDFSQNFRWFSHNRLFLPDPSRPKRSLRITNLFLNRIFIRLIQNPRNKILLLLIKLFHLLLISSLSLELISKSESLRLQLLIHLFILHLPLRLVHQLLLLNLVLLDCILLDLLLFPSNSIVVRMLSRFVPQERRLIVRLGVLSRHESVARLILLVLRYFFLSPMLSRDYPVVRYSSLDRIISLVLQLNLIDFELFILQIFDLLLASVRHWVLPRILSLKKPSFVLLSLELRLILVSLDGRRSQD